MSLVLYYAPMTSAGRVLWALDELGLPYEKVKLDLDAGEQKTPEYLRLNPNGKVPLLVADGTPIFESLAILLYLAEAYGVEKGLYPPPGVVRGEALKWMVWGYVTLGEAIFRFLRNTSGRFPEEQRNVHSAEAARKELLEILGVLEGALRGKDYLLGGGFTFVDLATSGWIGFLGRLGFGLSAFPSVQAWSSRCTQRPAFTKAMQS